MIEGSTRYHNGQGGVIITINIIIIIIIIINNIIIIIINYVIIIIIIDNNNTIIIRGIWHKTSISYEEMSLPNPIKIKRELWLQIR